MNIDPTSSKYVIRASIRANGVVNKSDVVGAVFGQTEGLLGCLLYTSDAADDP